MKKKTKDSSKISTLTSILQLHFDGKMNLARIRFISLLFCSLCKVQTVCFEKLAVAFDSQADSDSSLRRIQRFMANYELCTDLIARLIVSILPSQSPWTLSMDRTNWKFGSVDINILVVAITYQGIAFPVIYTMLPKRGNSNTAERIDIIDRFIKLFGIETIKHLVADREFVGQEWINYLNSIQIRHYLRIKNNFYVINPQTSKKIKVGHLFNSVKINEFRSLSKIYIIHGQYCYLAASKIKNREGKPELQIIVSFNKPEHSKEICKERWQIETAFKALKSSGFNIEDTHLRDINRIERLLAVALLAFTWAYITGIYVNDNVKKIRICKHGYKAKSFIKEGLDFIANLLLTHSKPRIMNRIYQFLSCS